MAWIESHQELARHPKTRRLARLASISVPQAIGHLHLLWWWALDYADDGDLSRYSPEDIEDAVLWESERGELFRALQQSGFIDPDGRIHDWDEYAGRLLEQRRRDAERKRRSRGHPTDIQRTADVTGPNPTGPNPTGPNPTGPNPTGPNPTGPTRPDQPDPCGAQNSNTEPAERSPSAQSARARSTRAAPKKPPVVNLAPLFDAFRAIGLRDPPVGGAQSMAAGRLLQRYSAEEIAACWQDVLTDGEFWDRIDQKNLSFTWLENNNRLGNWLAFREQRNGNLKRASSTGRTTGKRGYSQSHHV